LLTTVVLDGVYKPERKEADGEFVLRVTYPTEAMKILIPTGDGKVNGENPQGRDSCSWFLRLR